MCTGQAASPRAVPRSSHVPLPELPSSHRDVSPYVAECIDRLRGASCHEHHAAHARHDVFCELVTSEFSEPVRIIGGLESAGRAAARVELLYPTDPLDIFY